jgi:fructose-bisphosphate aldolase class I
MNKMDLERTARALVAPGKGILAADESTPTLSKRFQAINLLSTEDTRRAYREMLFTAPQLEEFISGAILFDETIRQRASNGTPLVEILKQKGIILGIKVDKGAKSLALFPDEKITEGLDGLRERLQDYVKMGARFTKWRAVIRIGNGIPTDTCMTANAHALARFAALSQEAGLVPIVEPEVLMDGDHTMGRCEEVTWTTLRIVFKVLSRYRVAPQQMLLKVNMITAGKDSILEPSVLEVAEATLRCLVRSVPNSLPGIVFLSGGQDDVLATQRLNTMNQLDKVPWQLGFSFARALQAPALQQWRGDNLRAGQQALLHRAWCNNAVRYGQYSDEMESQKLAA